MFLFISWSFFFFLFLLAREDLVCKFLLLQPRCKPLIIALEWRNSTYVYIHTYGTMLTKLAAVHRYFLLFFFSVRFTTNPLILPSEITGFNFFNSYANFRREKSSRTFGKYLVRIDIASLQIYSIIIYIYLHATPVYAVERKAPRREIIARKWSKGRMNERRLSSLLLLWLRFRGHPSVPRTPWGYRKSGIHSSLSVTFTDSYPTFNRYRRRKK